MASCQPQCGARLVSRFARPGCTTIFVAHSARQLFHSARRRHPRRTPSFQRAAFFIMEGAAPENKRPIDDGSDLRVEIIAKEKLMKEQIAAGATDDAHAALQTECPT